MDRMKSIFLGAFIALLAVSLLRACLAVLRGMASRPGSCGVTDCYTSDSAVSLARPVRRTMLLDRPIGRPPEWL